MLSEENLPYNSERNRFFDMTNQNFKSSDVPIPKLNFEDGLVINSIKSVGYSNYFSKKPDEIVVDEFSRSSSVRSLNTYQTQACGEKSLPIEKFNATVKGKRSSSLPRATYSSRSQN